ncbi:MAG: translation initiation factor IF-2, partial [Variovorax sp.]
MSSTTVAEFANELKKTPETLLDQLKSAGVPKAAPTDALTEADKQRLLGFLKASHGTAEPERKKITLTKKSTSEIKQADATGRARTIQVEVRKKRTFIQRDEGTAATPEQAPQAQAPAEAPAAPRIDEAELARREEEARRQAELIRRQEEELAEKRRAREETEAREREQAERAEQAEKQAQAEAAKQKEAATPAKPAKGATKTVAPDEAATAAAAEKAAADATAAQAKEDAKAKAAAESKARADEEAERAKDLDERRRKALAEAEAIRAMMNAPARVLVPHKAPEKEVPKPAVKGTLHKPATPAARPGAPAAPGSTAPGASKDVKSAKLSSSWAGDPAKKKEIKTRGDASGGVGRGNWRGGPRGRRGNDRGGHEEQVQAAPVEARVLEVHVPETITVAELAHKMAVKAQEVIKQLMKLGMMATINQSLDQDTAMIIVE